MVHFFSYWPNTFDQTGVDVVIPTEHIPFTHHLVRAGQVVLGNEGIVGIAIGELVDVHPEITTSKWSNGLEVVRTLVIETATDREVLVVRSGCARC